MRLKQDPHAAQRLLTCETTQAFQRHPITVGQAPAFRQTAVLEQDRVAGPANRVFGYVLVHDLTDQRKHHLQ